MNVGIWKQPQFITGLIILVSLLVASFVYPYFFELPKETKYLYENGNLVDVAPFPPSLVPPFGTDVFGRNLLALIINGAKYTLLIAFGIAMVRVMLGAVLAVIYHHYHDKLRPLFEDIIESTLFIPPAILGYVFLSPLAVKYSQENSGFAEMVATQSLVLILMGVPPLVSVFSKDMAKITDKEHIVSTLSLGAKNRYVYFKHVLPEMASRFWLVIAQQIIQVLILLSHLGVLYIFIGGAATIIDGDLLSAHEVYVSLTGEWAGLIGSNYEAIYHTPHIVLIPLGFFFLAIFSMNLVINGIQNNLKWSDRGRGW
ncbi:ABC transporter permease subunit [Thalassobacillus pellis]|uniref:ABC transporter permease subunit n=1 Tax=Thalassobacillus pellis TaxID=748008 RepID=UPI001961BB0C|nr:ABC transporter permease subunit [Thalassobacillus pellis]MBM7553889.1 peptide/nickel transport system permease protein [Thalassobacillus pellis]